MMSKWVRYIVVYNVNPTFVNLASLEELLCVCMYIIHTYIYIERNRVKGEIVKAMAMAAGRALGLSKGLLLRSSEMGFFSSASFCYSSSSSSSQFLQTLIHPLYRSPLHYHHKGRLLSVSSLSSPQEAEEVEEHSLLLERLRSRHLPKPTQVKETKLTRKVNTKMKKKEEASGTSASSPSMISSSFSDLSLSEELLSAVNELGLTQPTEVQCRAIPAVLDGKSVVIASHTGSGKTLAYMLPLVQVFLPFIHCKLLFFSKF